MFPFSTVCFIWGSFMSIAQTKFETKGYVIFKALTITSIWSLFVVVFASTNCWAPSFFDFSFRVWRSCSITACLCHCTAEPCFQPLKISKTSPHRLRTQELHDNLTSVSSGSKMPDAWTHPWGMLSASLPDLNIMLWPFCQLLCAVTDVVAPHCYYSF